MITKPTLLLDESKCRRNIKNMFAKAQEHGLTLRPHFKTHQSLEIGRWFKELGVNKITVSSVAMAAYFASEWDDITIAFPINILEVDAINQLAEKITLNVLVENEEAIAFLGKNLNHKLNAFLKIDVGYHRTGLSPSNHKLIQNLIDGLDTFPLMHFAGFLGHAGHTYRCRNKEDIRKVHAESLAIMSSLKEEYVNRYPELVISLGDTPSCSVASDFTGVDEIRPGNFVFYDLTQNLIGSNTIDQIAVALACPIVAIHRDRNEVVVYGGGVHLSKDRIEHRGKISFGSIARKTDKGWGRLIPEAYVRSLSQEHGIISVPTDEISNCSIGETLLILPVHSCMCANLMKSYTTLEGREISRL